MSVFVAEVLPCGIVFAADKNVTLTRYAPDGQTISSEQDFGTKILRWPRSRALVGYVGCARVGDQTMYDWLYDFIGDHVDFDDPADVAFDMRDRLQAGLGPGCPPSIVQFAAYARRDGYIVPEYWSITNVVTMTGPKYDDPVDQFEASERLLGVHLKGQVIASGIRDCLRMMAQQSAPFWFHQGIDLELFNLVSDAVRQALAYLQDKGSIPIPHELNEWERYARMWVLTYGAYYEAFGRPGERYVGGGADVLSIPWPDSL